MLDAVLLGLGAVALAIAWSAGVFRARGMIRPDRIDDNAARVLLVITLLAFCAWSVVPALFITRSEVGNSTTAPTTTNADAETHLSPEQMVTLTLVGASAGLLVLLIGDATLRPPGGAMRLGLSPSLLPQGLALGVLGSLILIPITLAATIVTDWAWRRFHIEHPKAHELLLILGRSDARGLRTMVYISALAMAPIFEEIFFRGHVQVLLVHWCRRIALPSRGVSENTGSIEQTIEARARWLAIIVASALFSLAHASWTIPPIFVLSLGLGYAYERTGNLWVPIVMHAAFNILNVSVFVSLNGTH